MVGLTHLLTGTHFFCFGSLGPALLHSFPACSWLRDQNQQEVPQVPLSALPGFGNSLVQPFLSGASYHQLGRWGPGRTIHPGEPSEKTLLTGSFRRVARLGRTKGAGKTLTGKSGKQLSSYSGRNQGGEHSIHRAQWGLKR